MRGALDFPELHAFSAAVARAAHDDALLVHCLDHGASAEAMRDQHALEVAVHKVLTERDATIAELRAQLTALGNPAVLEEIRAENA